jgi:hypothetical protein
MDAPQLKQHAGTVMMVRPVDFSFNWQTAVNNTFQNQQHGLDADTVRTNAEKEFDDFVQLLESNRVEVIVFNDTPDTKTPDSIFPNNWISLDQQGRVVLYPMYAENRRLERRGDMVEYFQHYYDVADIIDLTGYEQQPVFLEGTGSMVIDYVHRVVYACLSPRTHRGLLDVFCQLMGYKACAFTSLDALGKQVYHTNVMMCIGEKLAVVCLESIANPAERQLVADSLTETGHEIVDITFEQMNHFAGNMLEVCNATGERLLVMSAQARQSLRADQVALIEKYDTILAPAIPTIETIGGGGVRCMLAEVFLKKKNEY